MNDGDFSDSYGSYSQRVMPRPARSRASLWVEPRNVPAKGSRNIQDSVVDIENIYYLIMFSSNIHTN